MRLKRLYWFIGFTLLLSFSMSAQTLQSDETKQHSQSKSKIYRNYLYNFTIEYPSEWREISSDDFKSYAELGKELLKPNEKGKKELDKSAKLTRNFLSISKHEPGTPNNSSLICADELNQSPQATIEQSALATQKFFVQNLGYTATSSVKQVKLGNRLFMQIKLKKSFETGIILFQSIYIRKADNRILQFVSSYLSSEDGDSIEKVLETLKFSE